MTLKRATSSWLGRTGMRVPHVVQSAPSGRQIPDSSSRCRREEAADKVASVNPRTPH
jgi:hypothetical protein